MKTLELLKKAVSTWGVKAQVLMLAEEASELSAAALHSLRSGRGRAREELAAEIADTEIMIAQWRLMAEDNDLLIRKAKALKLQRLADRLKTYSGGT